MIETAHVDVVIVSGGDGLFPEELVREFKLLRDRVPAEPFPVERRERILEEGRLQRAWR